VAQFRDSITHINAILLLLWRDRRRRDVLVDSLNVRPRLHSPWDVPQRRSVLPGEELPRGNIFQFALFDKKPRPENCNVIVVAVCSSPSYSINYRYNGPLKISAKSRVPSFPKSKHCGLVKYFVVIIGKQTSESTHHSQHNR